MISEGLPYAKRTELKLAMKQSVRNSNTLQVIIHYLKNLQLNMKHNPYKLLQ